LQPCSRISTRNAWHTPETASGFSRAGFSLNDSSDVLSPFEMAGGAATLAESVARCGQTVTSARMAAEFNVYVLIIHMLMKWPATMVDKDIAAGISFELHTVARLMRRKFDRRARAHGLSRSRWQALWHLVQKQGIKQAELAERLNVAPISLARQLDRLEQAGLVERRRDEQDRRCFRIYLTGAVDRALETLRPLAESTRAEALAGLSASEVKQLHHLLSRVHRNLGGEENWRGNTEALGIAGALVRHRHGTGGGGLVHLCRRYREDRQRLYQGGQAVTGSGGHRRSDTGAGAGQPAGAPWRSAGAARRYRLPPAVAEAEGHVAQVRNQLLARRAEYAEQEAALEQARRDAAYYERQLARSEKLGSLAISESQLDESRQDLAAARSQIAITMQKLSSLRAELGATRTVRRGSRRTSEWPRRGLTGRATSCPARGS
jgi:MarR family transcriptional regulator for hemolysin